MKYMPQNLTKWWLEEGAIKMNAFLTKEGIGFHKDAAGNKKPLGYVPLRNITEDIFDENHQDFSSLHKEMKKDGLKVLTVAGPDGEMIEKIYIR